ALRDVLRLQSETARRRDVLQVHRTERRPQSHERLDDLVDVGRVEHQRDRVQVRERLEEHGLALHDGQRRLRPNVAEPEYRGAVAHHGDEAVRPRVTRGQGGVIGDGTTDLRYTGRVGDGQVTRLLDRVGGGHRELAALMTGEDVFVAH